MDLTRRLGTSFREDRIVRGKCEQADCTEPDTALLYAPSLDTLPDVLMCADHSRQRAAANPRSQPCDECGATGNVWRDPLNRKETRFLCVKCHDPEHLFQNRWANSVRQSPTHSLGRKPVCGLKDRGTDCKGEIKWRSPLGMEACNKHAGKVSSNPANN